MVHCALHVSLAIPKKTSLHSTRHALCTLFLTVCVCVYVCVCLHSSNFILTSVVLTGLSWGAVLTDGHKEKQQKSEASKCHQHQPAAQPSSRCVRYRYRKRKSVGFVQVPLIHLIDTESIGEEGELETNGKKDHLLVPDP